MSEQHISERELAALGFRILGVVILLSGIVQAAFLVGSLAQGDWSSWGLASLLGSLITLVSTAAVALPLIFRGEWLAGWLFPESKKTLAFAVTGRDLLACGLALVGAWFLATNLPYLARLVVELIWHAEGSRRSQLVPAFFSRAAFDILGSVFACVAGWVLFRHARRITDWWEPKARGES